jgi:hypothetical protein
MSSGAEGQEVLDVAVASIAAVAVTGDAEVLTAAGVGETAGMGVGAAEAGWAAEAGGLAMEAMVTGVVAHTVISGVTGAVFPPMAMATDTARQA